MTEDLAAASKARRTELASEWIIESPQLNAERKAGRALGAYDDTRHLWCFPKYQFHDGELIPEMSEILTILRAGVCRGPSGWGEVEWFMSPHVLLEGLSPYEVLAHEPKAVLKAAQVEFLKMMTREASKQFESPYSMASFEGIPWALILATLVKFGHWHSSPTLPVRLLSWRRIPSR